MVAIIQSEQKNLEIERENVEVSEMVILKFSPEGMVNVIDASTLKIVEVALGETAVTATIAANAALEKLTAECKVKVMASTAVEDVAFVNIVIAPNLFDAQLRIVNGALRDVYTLFNAQGSTLIGYFRCY